MWGGVGRCGEIRDVGRYGEMWICAPHLGLEIRGDMGLPPLRCREMWSCIRIWTRDTELVWRLYGEVWGGVERCGDVWGGVERCGEVWGGVER